jgi:hypothetical protein
MRFTSLSKGLALGTVVLAVASCGVSTLGRLPAGKTLTSFQAQGKPLAWPPAKLIATVETISGGRSPNDYGYVANVPAAQARYKLPNGLTYANNKLYITQKNNVVTTLSLKNGELFASELVGDPKSEEGDQDGTGKQARFTDPRDIAFGPDGLLYLSEYMGHAIRTVKDNNMGPGTAGTVRVVEQIASFPSGIAVGKSGAIYVTDLGEQQVVKIVKMPDGKLVQSVLYKAKTEEDPIPLGLTVDDKENVYFTAFTQIFKMDANGKDFHPLISTLPVLGRDLAYANGHLVVACVKYVVDVNLITHDVKILAGGDKFGADDGVGSQATFGNAASVCFGDGALYVADANNHRICRLTFK